MAKVEIALVTVGGTGSAVTNVSVDGSNGMKFKNSGHEYLYIESDATSDAATITVVASGYKGGQGFDDTTVAVAGSGAIKIAGPFPPDIYNVTSGTDAGCVTLTFAGAGTADTDIGYFR